MLLPCIHASGKRVFVNRLGMIKLGLDGPIRKGTSETIIRLVNAEYDNVNDTIMIPFLRIMASTFVPLLSSFIAYPRIVYVNTAHESYTHGMADASILSWDRNGQSSLESDRDNDYKWVEAAYFPRPSLADMDLSTMN